MTRPFTIQISAEQAYVIQLVDLDRLYSVDEIDSFEWISLAEWPSYRLFAKTLNWEALIDKEEVSEFLIT
jgi:hypothetical protein